MAENVLEIEYNDNVPEDLKALVPGWLQEVMEWLLSQPRPADLTGLQPRFSEQSYSVAMGSPNYGLRSRTSGKGWSVLGISQNVVIETRPNVISIPSTVDVATRSRWLYLLSQDFRAENFSDDNFRWREHLDFQLRYLEEIAPDVAAEAKAQLATIEAEEKQKKYKSQLAEKRKLQQDAQRERRRFKEPWEYKRGHKPTYSKPPAPLPPQPAPPPVQHPTPTLSADDQHALETLRGHQRYMAVLCKADGSAEDHDM